MFAVFVSLAALGISLGASPPQSATAKVPYSSGTVLDSERTILHGDIAHYRYDVRVGSGEFDRIRLHRVVRERKPGLPVSTVEGVFLLPGWANAFEMIFMTPSVSPALEWDHSIVAYLAKHDIDVWGMDYAWALVPAETTDFGFMEDWGFQKEIDNVDAALSVARRLRLVTGQGPGRMHLLGFSYGVALTYALAGAETQRPYGLRRIKGIIPVDSMFKTDVESLRVAACADAVETQARIDAGEYVDQTGAFLQYLGSLAVSAPDDASDIFGGLTNLQAVLAIGSSGIPHFVGGSPFDLLYTLPEVFADALQAVPPYFPLPVSVDTAAIGCDMVDVPFDDHLGEITIPILYVGAAGGNSRLGEYSMSLTASNDITSVVVQLLPDEDAATDFGHADIFLAQDADVLVWQPILDWLVAHSSPALQQPNQ